MKLVHKMLFRVHVVFVGKITKIYTKYHVEEICLALDMFYR